MSVAIKISEAAVLGIHAMIYMAQRPDRKVSTKEIADFHRISDNHLSKVLQRLVRAGYVTSVRGPGGGFELAKDPDEIKIISLYELFDGPLALSECLFDRPVCIAGGCLFGNLLHEVNGMIEKYMGSTRLSAFIPKNNPKPE